MARGKEQSQGTEQLGIRAGGGRTVEALLEKHENSDAGKGMDLK